MSCSAGSVVVSAKGVNRHLDGSSGVYSNGHSVHPDRQSFLGLSASSSAAPNGHSASPDEASFLAISPAVVTPSDAKTGISPISVPSSSSAVLPVIQKGNDAFPVSCSAGSVAVSAKGVNRHLDGSSGVYSNGHSVHPDRRSFLGLSASSSAAPNGHSA